MKKEDVEPYLGQKVKVLLKGSTDRYHGIITNVGEASFIINDIYQNDVAVDYDMCGLITPFVERGEGQ